MNYKQAKEKHFAQFYGGVEYGKPKPRYGYEFPYGSIYKYEEFILSDIPLNIIEARCIHSHLVDVYSENFDSGMEPVWLSIGRKLKNNTIAINYSCKFDVFDGNHRVLAAKKNKHSVIKSIMPESHYEFYKEMSRDKIS